MSVAKISNIGGGVKLVDINPNKTAVGSGDIGYLYIYCGNAISTITICGYKKFSASFASSITGSILRWRFAYSGGTFGSWTTINVPISPTYTSWFGYVDIPENAVGVQLQKASGSESDFVLHTRLSLLA